MIVRGLRPGYYAALDGRGVTWALRVGTDARVTITRLGPAPVRATHRAYHWTQALIAGILADPVAASELYASITSRCRICGRTLTDPDSRLAGIGPTCAAQLGGGA